MHGAGILQASLVALWLAAAPAIAQPLYLGSQEVQTDDAAAMSEVLDRCEALARRAAEAQGPAPLTGQDEMPVPLTLAPEAALSSGDDGEAAGEGAGDGPNPDEGGADDGDDDDAPDLAAMTLADCKEAGLVY